MGRPRNLFVEVARIDIDEMVYNEVTFAATLVGKDIERYVQRLPIEVVRAARPSIRAAADVEARGWCIDIEAALTKGSIDYRGIEA